MSTNSTITIQHVDDSCESIYCHWDGYLEWNGQLLYAFYNTAEKVQELIDHGDLSALGMSIGEQMDGDALDPKRIAQRTTNFQCEFYARDNGEDKLIRKGNDINRIDAQDYNYVFSEKEGVWYIYDEKMANKQLLKDALAMDYMKRGFDKDYLFKADTSFRIPMSDTEILLKDIATAEQLARLDVLKADITQEASLTLTRFDCADDLSQYTDSLLFTDDEVPAVADFMDDKGNNINLRIIVTGEVYVAYKGETYENPDDFPDELKALIRSGDAYYNGEACDVYVEACNWFELVYSITNASGVEIAYEGFAFERNLSIMTTDDLKDYLAGYAESLYKTYVYEIAENTEPPKKQKNDIERND